MSLSAARPSVSSSSSAIRLPAWRTAAWATEDDDRWFAAAKARAYSRSRALVLMVVSVPGAASVGQVGPLAAQGVRVAGVRDRAPQVHLAQALGIVLRDELERLVQDRHRLRLGPLPLRPL